MAYKSSNPLIKATEIVDENIDMNERKADIKLVRLHGLYLSAFLFVLTSILLLQVSTDLPFYLILIIGVISLLVAIIILFLLSKVKRFYLLLSLLYILFQALAISFIALILQHSFQHIYSGGKYIYNNDAVIFITIAYTVITSIFIAELIYNLNLKALNNFWVKFCFIYLWIMFFSIGIIYYISRSIDGYNFWTNLISSLATSLIVTCFTMIYSEEVRKSIQNGAFHKHIWLLSLAPLVSPIYLFVDFIKLIIFKPTK